MTAYEFCLPDGYDVAWFWSQVAQAAWTQRACERVWREDAAGMP